MRKRAIEHKELVWENRAVKRLNRSGFAPNGSKQRGKRWRKVLRITILKGWE